MRRLYRFEDYVDFLERVREMVPDICLGSDVMVGFPGEGEKEFAAMYQSLQNLPLAYFHVFSFSERGDTPAVTMPEKVDSKQKKARSASLRELSSKKKHAFATQQIGKRVRVLVEERNRNGEWQGFTDNYIKVAVEDERDLQNRMVDVELQAVRPDGLAVGRVTDGPGDEQAAPLSAREFA